MKKFIISLFIGVSLFIWNVSAWVFDDTDTSIKYCQWNECWLQQWVDKVKEWVSELETDEKFSEYIQKIIIYLLWFLTLIAVIYVIYAWFNILISWWNEEKVKKSKSTIFYVIIWIVVIWFAWTIATWAVTLWAWGQVTK